MTWEHCAREGKPRGAPPPTSNIAYCCFRTQLLAQVLNMMKDAKLKGRVRADGYCLWLSLWMYMAWQV
jgi:hypothetical protein